MNTVVAFTQEYSKVSISSGNEKCREPEQIRLGYGDEWQKGKGRFRVERG
jgi:hypothetical protein